MVRRGISMKVVFGEIFYQYFRNFPKSDQQKIAKFVDDVETYGLDGLQGRNKASDSVQPMTPIGQKKLPMPKNIIFGIITSEFHNTKRQMMASK